MITKRQSVRAAVVQAAPVAFERERTLDKVRCLTTEAASQGAQLVVFPEAFLSLSTRTDIRGGGGQSDGRGT